MIDQLQQLELDRIFKIMKRNKKIYTNQDHHTTLNDCSKTNQQFQFSNLAINRRAHSKNNVINAFSTLIAFLFPPVHSLLTYFLLANDETNNIYTTPISGFVLQAYVYRTFQTTSAVITLFLVVATVITPQYFKNLTKSPFFSLFMQKYQLLVQINLIFCFLLGLLKFSQNLVLLVLSSALVVFKNVFIENYHYKNQKNYQLSSQLSLSFKLAQIIAMSLNCFAVNLISFELLVVCSVLCGIFVFLWNIRGGFKLFKSQEFQLVVHTVTAVMVSQSLQYFLIWLHSQDDKTFSLIELIIEVTVLLVFLIANDYKWTHECVQHLSDKTDLKVYQSILYNISNQIDSDFYANQEKNCLLIGIFKEHMLHTCLNPKCLLRSQASFTCDNRQISTLSLFKKKDLLLKMYFKCVYQSAIMRQKTSKNMIDYCEFMLSEFSDFSTHCFYLQKLVNTHNLGTLQKIKVQHLKSILKVQSQNLNRLIFGSKIELIDLFHSDMHYQLIMDNIRRYCQESIIIWKNISNSVIDEDVMKSKINNLFSIIPQINQRWSELSKYFHMQKYWNFIYLSYNLFLRNEEITPRALNSLCDLQLKDKKKVMNYASQEVLHQLTHKNQIFFQNSTILYICEYRNNQLVILNTNQAFLDEMEYQREQINQCSLNKILPHYLRRSHNNKISNWLQNYSSVESSNYFAKYSHIISKSQQQLPAIVMFSLFVDYSDQGSIVKFLGFIKILNRGQNSNFGIVPKNNFDLPYQIMPLPQFQTNKVKLISQNNIFLKQNFRPKAKHSSITNIHITFFIIVLVLVIILVIMVFSICNFNLQASLKADQQLFFINLYRFPMALVKNYYKIILGIGNKSTVTSQISQATATLTQYQSNVLTIQTLSDKTLNIPKIYGPFHNSTINRGITYNQIDIFYLVYSSIISLSKEVNINRNGTNFRQLNSYLKPSYDQMINSTKLNFHLELQNQISLMISVHLGLIVGQVCLFFIVSIYLLVVYFNYHNKMKELLITILNFSHIDISTCIQYWRKVIAVFKIVNIANKSQRQLKKEVLITKDIRRINNSFILKTVQKDKNHQNQKTQSAILNKQVKIIGPSKKDKGQMYKVFLSVVVLNLLIFFTASVAYVTNLSQLQSLGQFQEQGFQQLQHFPTTTVLGYALMDQCYSKTFPNQYTFQLSRFQDTLSTLKIITEYNYLKDQMSDSKYIMQLKNYFFGNPCTYNPAVLNAANSSLAKCAPILSSGISSYLRSVYPQINNYLNGNLSMTPNDVDSLTSGLTLTAYYMTDALQTWEIEFKAKISKFASINQTLLPLLCGILVLIYFLIVRCWLMPVLQKNFKFNISLFQCFVPERILRHQKMTKQLFCSTGILSYD